MDDDDLLLHTSMFRVKTDHEKQLAQQAKMQYDERAREKRQKEQEIIQKTKKKQRERELAQAQQKHIQKELAQRNLYKRKHDMCFVDHCEQKATHVMENGDLSCKRHAPGINREELTIYIYAHGQDLTDLISPRLKHRTHVVFAQRNKGLVHMMSVSEVKPHLEELVDTLQGSSQLAKLKEWAQRQRTRAIHAQADQVDAYRSMRKRNTLRDFMLAPKAFRELFLESIGVSHFEMRTVLKADTYHIIGMLRKEGIQVTPESLLAKWQTFAHENVNNYYDRELWHASRFQSFHVTRPSFNRAYTADLNENDHMSMYVVAWDDKPLKRPYRIFSTNQNFHYMPDELRELSTLIKSEYDATQSVKLSNVLRYAIDNLLFERVNIIDMACRGSQSNAELIKKGRRAQKRKD